MMKCVSHMRRGYTPIPALFGATQEEAPQSKRQRSAGGSVARAPHGAEVLVEEHEAPISGAELLDTQVRFHDACYGRVAASGCRRRCMVQVCEECLWLCPLSNQNPM
jgi:hypothetical protein